MITEYLQDYDIYGLPDNEEVDSVRVSYSVEIVKASKSPGFTLHFAGTATIAINVYGQGVGEVDENGREEKVAVLTDEREVCIDIDNFYLEECHTPLTQRYESLLEVNFCDEEKPESTLMFETR